MKNKNDTFVTGVVHGDLLTREKVQSVFSRAFEQMKNWYMLMHIDKDYYYFKHKLTRQYIKVEREGEK
tara:strand:+ start:3217 stop:3420 length:204 start_codon:yes stop_codon:yes gene_type:complete